MSFATYGLLNCSNLITIKTACMGGGGYLVACPTNLYGRSFFFQNKQFYLSISCPTSDEKRATPRCTETPAVINSLQFTCDFACNNFYAMIR